MKAANRYSMFLLYNFRFLILDVILRAVEALSVIDGYSQDISSNKELFQLVLDLVKLPDKVEVQCIPLEPVDYGFFVSNVLLIYEISDLLFCFTFSSRLLKSNSKNSEILAFMEFGNYLATNMKVFI